MKSKLFNKFFLIVSIIIIVSYATVFAILSFVISNYFSKEKYELLQDNCISVAKIASIDANSSNFKRNIYNIIRVQNDVSDIDNFICDTTGKIVLCGCDGYLMGEKCIHKINHIPQNILLKARQENFFEIGTVENLYSDNHYTVGIPLENSQGEIIGYVFSATSSETLKNILNTLRNLSLLSAIIPIIIAFIMLYSLTYRFSKPLRNMSEAAKKMAKGDFSHRIPVISDDEIGELSVSFNNMTDSLAKLEKMRRNFIGNVSHELRTPITTIAGFIDGMIDGTISGESREYYLNIVSNEIKRLSRVVESMLNLSELESGEVKLNPTNFNLSECLINILISREQIIEKKNIDIIGLDGIEPVAIYADYDLIYQAIYNLVDNAVKFTNDGGTISFKMVQRGSEINFLIKNTGPGIPKESLEHIFERFFKGDKSRSSYTESTGLGLFIVKKIIELHFGKIVADSKENDYTVFKIMLPTNYGGNI